MTRFQRLLFLTFIESFATIVIERGLYLYTRQALGYSDLQNLWLALGYGGAYVVGAQLSHRLTKRAGQRTMLLWLLVLHVALHTTMALVYRQPVLFIGADLALALVTGAKWPIVESYVSAGLTPRQTARAVGLFSISWALAAPPAMVMTGPLIELWSPGIFLAPAAINLLSLAISLRLEAKPLSLPHDHPERLAPSELGRLQALLTSSRWSMFSSYVLLFILAPLAPGVFARLGVSTSLATTLWGMIEVVRAGTFVALQRTHRWHGRTDLLLGVIVGLPMGFFLVLFGAHLPTAMAGELIFGVAAGLAYYSALYYAMVVLDASVDAGGDHEALVGGGFFVGPGLGLIGQGLAAPLGGYAAGMLAGVGPVVILCAAAAARPLLRRRTRGSDEPRP